MGGFGGYSQKLDKITGPMIANVAPTVNRLTTNLANKIDSNKYTRVANVIADKATTYGYKLNKADKQISMKNPT